MDETQDETSIRAKIADLRGRIDNAKNRAPPHVVSGVLKIAVRGSYLGEDALDRVLANLEEQRDFIKGKFPEADAEFAPR